MAGGLAGACEAIGQWPLLQHAGKPQHDAGPPPRCTTNVSTPGAYQATSANTKAHALSRRNMASILTQVNSPKNPNETVPRA